MLNICFIVLCLVVHAYNIPAYCNKQQKSEKLVRRIFRLIRTVIVLLLGQHIRGVPAGGGGELRGVPAGYGHTGEGSQAYRATEVSQICHNLFNFNYLCNTIWSIFRSETIIIQLIGEDEKVNIKTITGKKYQLKWNITGGMKTTCVCVQNFFRNSINKYFLKDNNAYVGIFC